MLYVFYRLNSEHERAVLDFQKELAKSAARVSLVDADSKEGADLCRLYDIVQYPSAVATAPTGSVLQAWNGQLPLLSEASYYAKL